MAKLIVDNREKELIKKLEAQPLEIEVKMLDIADFQFYYNDEPFLFIERKSINDLAQSIKDGRYREQKYRLKKSGVNVLYLIEGKMKDLKSGMNKDVLWGSMANTQFRDNFRVFRVENLDESVEFLVKIFNKLNSGEYSNTKQREYVETVQPKKKYKDQDNCFILQLCDIPGVSVNIAREISKVYPSMFQLIKGYMEAENDSECKKMLQNILIPIKGDKQRKLGKVVSERVFEYLKK